MTDHLDMTTLSAYLDNELPDALYARAHLRTCQHCNATLAELEALSRGLQALSCPPPPPELSARLQARFGTAPQRSFWQRRWVQTTSAAASLLLGLLLGSILQAPPPPSSASHSMLAVLGSAPPGSLCARSELCYLKGK